MPTPKKKLHVIIPAAGMGTRMRPLSSGVSKTLIPLNGRPVLSWILESISELDAEILSVTIVVGNNDVAEFISNVYFTTPIYNKISCIPQYMKYGYSDFFDEYSFDGPGGAIISAIIDLENKCSEDAGILVWLGDTVCTYNKFKFDDKLMVATAKVATETTNRWCIAVKDKYGNTSFLNKSAPTTSEKTVDGLIGIYYFPKIKQLVDHIHKNCVNYDAKKHEREIEISELITGYMQDTNNNNVDVHDVGDTWYDCGELETYYASKAKLLEKSCRVQSQLFVDSELGTIKKRGNTDESGIKIAKEIEWYKRLSKQQLLFVPKILETYIASNKDAYYVMDIAPGNTLSDMFIYENISVSGWKTILKRVIDNYHSYFAFENYKWIAYKNDGIESFDALSCYNKMVDEFYVYRPTMRILKNGELYESIDVPEFNMQTMINFILKFSKKAKDTFKTAYKSSNGLKLPRNMIVTRDDDEGMLPTIHGDFHLGNILFDSLTGRYTFLDPRGGNMYECKAGNHTYYINDTYYDIAKLYHDILCNYMLILRGVYTFHENRSIEHGFYDYIEFPERFYSIKCALLEYLGELLSSQYGYDVTLIKQLAVIQIMTCIPFHAENKKRCQALLTNAFDIMSKF